METTTAGAMKEKQIIKEIKFLGDSKEFINKVEELEKESAKKRKKKYEAAKGLTELKEEITTLKN